MSTASTNNAVPNTDLPPPAATAKKIKGKKDKPSAEENAKLIQARLAQLEQEKAGEKTQQAEVDREVKKESRQVDDELNKITSDQERADVIKRRYDDLFASMKKLERELAKSKKKSDQLQKEKDKITTEHNKATVQKDKMEKLSRTFQQDNKKLKDENGKLRESEKTAREDVNDRLDGLLYDVQDVMNSKAPSHAENLHLELDEVIKTRCKVLFDQAELRELHFKSILRHKDAEIAHLQAKHEVERKRADAEATRCRTLQSQVSTFSHTEAELRSQLNIYVEKFKQQVEDTLNNSNELFLTFRKEMEEMSKKTKMLEKENSKLTKKHDAVRKNIITMAEERDKHLREIDKLERADTKMRDIIKNMQEQGRSGPAQEMIDDQTESEYDEYDDEEDEEESYIEGEPEDDILVQENRPPEGGKTYGPEPPPKMVETLPNGPRVGTVVNGLKH
ncbi:hypothetical protein PMZ80_004034 [Knufia obscura]|uniref:Alpha-taxilin n=2 Tax=Knufia TaxID=430999 RepID=A0AAN8ECF6_9EURO|nr:hypothetical protein PMZ80_004034 [Knufia obscura]KAK5952239.1 hypothetical protein OHC33_006712 [Knufia fluminis]